MKFKKQGIKTSPFLWGIGTILPTIIVVFPVYLILHDVVWRRKLSKNSANTIEQKNNQERQLSVELVSKKKRQRSIQFLLLSAIIIAVFIFLNSSLYVRMLGCTIGMISVRTEQDLKIAKRIAENDTCGAKTPEETFDRFFLALKSGDTYLAARYQLMQPGLMIQKPNFLDDIHSRPYITEYLELLSRVRVGGEKRCMQKDGLDICGMFYNNEETNERPRGNAWMELVRNNHTGVWKIMLFEVNLK